LFRSAKARLLVIAGVALLFGCAPGNPLLRDESLHLLEGIRAAGVQELFPVQYQDLASTFDKGEELQLAGDVSAADEYFGFAITKAKLLESAYLVEVKAREAAALREVELKLQAEAELKHKQEQERAEAEAAAAKAAEEAKIAARKVAVERAEQAEARRRAERAKYEREQNLPLRHTVKRGETLPQIAALPEVYGEASLWPLLYRANRDQIRDPRVLWPGQQLKIL
jgi:nucleoid-associated protein YgaU